MENNQVKYIGVRKYDANKNTETVSLINLTKLKTYIGTSKLAVLRNVFDLCEDIMATRNMNYENTNSLEIYTPLFTNEEVQEFLKANKSSMYLPNPTISEMLNYTSSLKETAQVTEYLRLTNQSISDFDKEDYRIPIFVSMITALIIKNHNIIYTFEGNEINLKTFTRLNEDESFYYDLENCPECNILRYNDTVNAYQNEFTLEL